jgi:hypothetical protein
MQKFAGEKVRPSLLKDCFFGQAPWGGPCIFGLRSGRVGYGGRGRVEAARRNKSPRQMDVLIIARPVWRTRAGVEPQASNCSDPEKSNEIGPPLTVRSYLVNVN